MEFKMQPYSLPEKVLFNYEELKRDITEKCEFYEAMVFTDEQIKMAKSERANLNKLKKALADERIRLKKEYIKPFEDFEKKVKELEKIIDKPVAIIDGQIKDYEEAKRAEKQAEIEKFWAGCLEADMVPEGIMLDQIWDTKWLNASVSLKKVETEIDIKIAEIVDNLQMLGQLSDFGFEAAEVYKNTLDVNKAVAEAQRMAEIAKLKAEAEERRKAEEARHKEEVEKLNEEAQEAVDIINRAESKIEVEEQEEAPATTNNGRANWIAFQAYMTVEDARALRDFFESRNIEFKPV